MNNSSPPDLERFRNHLRILAEIELSPRLRVKEDPSDIVQQSLLEAHRDLASFRGQTDAELVAWLRTILAHNLANAGRHYQTQKRDLRREQVITKQLEQSSVQLENFLADDRTSPSQRAVHNEQVQRLADAMTLLLDDEKAAILLKHFQAWSLSQIGKHLGRSNDAVAGLLKRGLKKLRFHMQEQE